MYANVAHISTLYPPGVPRLPCVFSVVHKIKKVVHDTKSLPRPGRLLDKCCRYRQLYKQQTTYFETFIQSTSKKNAHKVPTLNTHVPSVMVPSTHVPFIMLSSAPNW